MPDAVVAAPELTNATRGTLDQPITGAGPEALGFQHVVQCRVCRWNCPSAH